MNGTNVQESIIMLDTLESTAANVLETMFFAEAAPLVGGPIHVQPLACRLYASGAIESTFSVAVDRTALLVLSESFYGDTPTATQPSELLCELTNMIAGSALSLYLPSHICPLSSPELCDVSVHLERAADPAGNLIQFAVEGGLISVTWSLNKK